MTKIAYYHNCNCVEGSGSTPTNLSWWEKGAHEENRGFAGSKRWGCVRGRSPCSAYLHSVQILMSFKILMKSLVVYVKFTPTWDSVHRVQALTVSLLHSPLESSLP